MPIQFATLIFLMSSVAAVDASPNDNRELEVVANIEVSRYTGKWFEIARFPNRFQKKCEADVRATYTQLEDGQLKVVNECLDKNGRTTIAEGRARGADKRGPNAKLEVRFAPSWLGWLPQVWGDYWIIDLAPDYSYSVVGTPDRKYLWILARSSRMDEDTYRGIVERAARKGFDTSLLVKTSQSAIASR